jgi:hypothetical protein
MMWLAWRQFRVQAAVAAGALAILAVVLACTGPHLVHLYDTTVATCAAHGDCSTAGSNFLTNDHLLAVLLNVLVVVVPALIGLFFGAPLFAREFETRTHRLAWTQSVTRTRWLAVKFGLVGVASMVVAGLFSLMVTWWSSPFDRANMSVFSFFDQRDIVPIGYAAFAFAFGAGAGVLIRRTLPTMAVTLVAFVAVRLSFLHWIRPSLVAPRLADVALNPTSTGFGSFNGGPFTLQANPPNISNAWIESVQIVDRAGQALTPQFVTTACPKLGRLLPGGPGGPVSPSGPATRVHATAGVQQTLQDCVAKVGTTYHELVTYQPSSHYRTMQWYELACFLGASVVLGALSLRLVRRGRS